MITWRDGLEESPSGEARELMLPRVCSSSVWITRDGTAFRRFYNSQTKMWTWGEPLAVSWILKRRRGSGTTSWAGNRLRRVSQPRGCIVQKVRRVFVCWISTALPMT